MDTIKRIDLLQTELVKKWHQYPPEAVITDNRLLMLVEQQHLQNFLLWHEEDIARAPDADDREIARVKRSIDLLNQKRNDLIEQIDETLIEHLNEAKIEINENAPSNSETPGSIIDRCSIMSLKIYHMNEQTTRRDVAQEHREVSTRKLRTLQVQREDLLECLYQLMEEIKRGTRKFNLYRQFKMYNDPSLNPRIYMARKTESTKNS